MKSTDQAWSGDSQYLEARLRVRRSAGMMMKGNARVRVGNKDFVYRL
jgi:hypothetical protein